MANPAVTYTFVNGNVADASQVNQNFTDIINGLTDGTKSLNIDALTCAGAFTANGSVDLGNAASDTISMTGYVDTNLTIKSTDAGATAGPDIIIDRDSASAADSDAIGRIIFRGNDDAGTPADNDYASIEATIIDSGAGSEDGKIDFKISQAGTPTSYLTIESTKGCAIRGRTDGVSASAGFIGEIKTNYTLRSAGIGLTSLTGSTIAVITLNPGIWIISASGAFICTSTGAYKYVNFSLSGLNATVPAADTEAVPANGQVIMIHSSASNTIATNYSVDLAIPAFPVSISTSTNIYLVAYCEFTSGSFNGAGSISAIRIA